jgi:hypothetical protein
MKPTIVFLVKLKNKFKLLVQDKAASNLFLSW